MGMTFDNTAWQKAETLETGLASSVREPYWRPETGAAEDGLDFFPPLADLVGGLDGGGRNLFKATCTVPLSSTCPGT